jgi:protein disulfide-isomerase
MREKYFLISLILFFGVFSIHAQQINNDKLIWAHTYKDALKIAKDKNLAVLLFFTGSDTCSNCNKMRDKIINTHEFIDYGKKTFVMLVVDYPAASAYQLTVEKIKENKKLQTKFNPSAKIPQLVVIDNHESVKASANYVDMPVNEYLSQFKALLNMFK